MPNISGTNSNYLGILNVKLKPVFLFLLLLAATGGVASYLLPAPKLLSPIIDQLRPPDLSEKLGQKIVRVTPLDYKRTQTIDTISEKITYLVYNPNTSQVYLAKNHTKPISPGSFTKLLTTQVAFDIAQDEDQLFTATKTSIEKEPTILGLKVGEQVSLNDLVRASIATSANDAAATIAEGLASYYHQPLVYFIEQMNQKATMLGLKNSHFANPEGYDDDSQYSTLEDIFILVSNAQQNYPYILYSGKSDMEDIATSSSHGRYYLPNWNGLLGVYPGVNGLKIAYTQKAGYSTIVTANRENIPVVVILQGAESIRERDLAAAALLDAAYMQERLAPARITRSKVDKRYKRWSDLATKIREELKVLGIEQP